HLPRPRGDPAGQRRHRRHAARPPRRGGHRRPRLHHPRRRLHPRAAGRRARRQASPSPKGALVTSAPSLRPYDPASLPAVTAALAERAADYDRTGAFPAESIQVLHEAGVLTATVGKRFGGAELGHAGTVDLMLALGEGDPSV